MKTIRRGPTAATAPVWLVRHGRTALNAAEQLRVRLDPPLDEVGQAEVAELARTLVLARPTGSSPARSAVPFRRHTRWPVRPAGGPSSTTGVDRDYGRSARQEPSTGCAQPWLPQITRPPGAGGSVAVQWPDL